MKYFKVVLFVCVLLCISAIYQTQNFGLAGASQVGAFINGILPFQSSPPTQSSLNMTAVKATPYLGFNKILSLTSEPKTNNVYVTDRGGLVSFYDNNVLVNSSTTFFGPECHHLERKRNGGADSGNGYIQHDLSPGVQRPGFS